MVGDNPGTGMGTGNRFYPEFEIEEKGLSGYNFFKLLVRFK
jgi:hypothetical protein